MGESCLDVPSQDIDSVNRWQRFLLISMLIVLLVDMVPGMGLGIVRGLSAKNLYLYALVIAIAIKAVTRPSGLKFTDLDVHIPFLLLIAYAILTVAILSISTPTYKTVQGVMTLKNQLVDLYLFMFIFRYGLESRSDFMWMLRFTFTVMCWLSVITVIDFLNIPDLGIVGTYKGRIEGPFGGANEYGALLAFLIPISIALIPRDSGVAKRWFWYCSIFIMSVLLIATGSRGAYVATIFGSLIGVLYLRKSLDMRTVFKYSGIAFVLILVLVIAFAAFNFDFLMERFEKSTSGSIEQVSSGRLAIWGATLGVMAEWPFSFIVGYGWNSYDSAGIWKAAHNEYLDRYFELGLPGLFLYAWVIYAVIVRAKKFIRNCVDQVEQSMMIAYIFSMLMIAVSIFFVALPDPWTIIWVVTGLLMGVQATSAEATTPVTKDQRREMRGQPTMNFGGARIGPRGSPVQKSGPGI